MYNVFYGSEISPTRTENLMSYTLAQENIIRKAAPVNKEVAEKLASKFGVSTRSVISKTISMKVAYNKEVRVPRETSIRKAVVVTQIEALLKIQAPSLVNAKAVDLATLLAAVE